MGMLEKIGRYIDRVFIDKATLPEVDARLSGLAEATHKDLEILQNRVDILERGHASNLSRLNTIDENILKMRDELNSVKAFLRMGQKSGNNDLKPPQRFDGSEPWKR